MAHEEEVLIEVEAVESVYGDDCVVLQNYPPHLRLQFKPRTADVSSQQFVEAIIGICASSKYPDEPPNISIIDSKGLDEQRQKHLISSIRSKACELSSNSMLVALCEEAVELLTNMNHPDGDCPLCLSSLVEDGASNKALPFMKLMSCFHCFHCECIIRWWNWLQMHKEVDNASSSGQNAHPQETRTKSETYKNVEDSRGICPVCRNVFQAKDIEHVLDLVGAYSQSNLDDTKDTERDELLNSDSENRRRQKFESILKLQQEKNGLIELKKTEVLMPGMYLPRPVTPDKEPAEQQHASSSNRRNPGSRRKYGGRNPRSQQPSKQWIVKDNGKV